MFQCIFDTLCNMFFLTFKYNDSFNKYFKSAFLAELGRYCMNLILYTYKYLFYAKQTFSRLQSQDLPLISLFVSSPWPAARVHFLRTTLFALAPTMYVFTYAPKIFAVRFCECYKNMIWGMVLFAT